MTLPNAPLVPTGWQTIGPFFPRTFFQEGDNDLTRLAPEAPATAQGEVVLLHGLVLQEGGGACVNAVLEAWQADAGGRFRHPADPQAALADTGFMGWGRAWTDATGHYSFRTIIPGGYRDGTGTRAPHINLGLLASGVMRRLVTTVFFPEFGPANAADPVLNVLPAALRPRLLAVPDGMEDGCRRFRFDLLLRGEADEETPFFLD